MSYLREVKMHKFIKGRKNLININLKDEESFEIFQQAKLNSLKNKTSLTNLVLKLLDNFNQGKIKIKI
jgi:hypothetical protein